MIDFHNHILPGIDDGSRDSEMSLAMLRMEREQGVTEIVFTPHFYAQEDSVTHFIKKREHSVSRLEEAAARQERNLCRIIWVRRCITFGTWEMRP